MGYSEIEILGYKDIGIFRKWDLGKGWFLESVILGNGILGMWDFEKEGFLKSGIFWIMDFDKVEF